MDFSKQPDFNNPRQVGMNWLITGGCGFIGTNLIKYLVHQGNHCIRIVDNLSVGTTDDLEKVCAFKYKKVEDLSNSFGEGEYLVEFIKGDLLDEQLSLKAAQGADVIIHLAANTGVAPSVKDPRFDCITNVIGTLNYLEASRHNQVKRFVLASSGGTVIGECKPPIHEEMVPHPVSPYGASKLAAEGYCSAYFGTFGIETVALRFSNVYGPGSSHKNSVVAKFIRRVLAGNSLEIYGDGTQSRDFIFIDDLVKAIYNAATVPNIGGEVFQIATNQETTVNELAKKLKSVFTALKIENIKIDYTDSKPGEIKRNFSDTSKAQEILNWHHEVELDDGLKQTVIWFLEEINKFR